VALRFDFIPALEVDSRQRVERRQVGERWLGQMKETTLKVGWARVGHVGRVMLAWLAHNRKKKRKKARDGLGRG
jgi:hypothetical protein